MRGRRFFPLDQQLKLRADSWSGGAARVATRLGLQSPSFQKAAEGFEDAVGVAISKDSVRRLTQQFGAHLEADRVALADQVATQGSDPQVALETLVALAHPLHERANLSSDGGMLRVREEGYKEVKLATLSQVVHAPQPKRPRRGYAPHDPVVQLEAHSYVAGLWEADAFAPQQYVEGLRRGLPQVKHLTSVNDGAAWIERVTQTNFPQAQRILDWHHAQERLQGVAEAVFGEAAATGEWLATTTEALWHGQTPQVVAALTRLAQTHAPAPDQVGQARTYFQHQLDTTDYPAYRASGAPIGSGTVESAVNVVVHHRLRRQGPGWRRDTGQAMLAALSAFHSDRFLDAWQQMPARAA